MPSVTNTDLVLSSIVSFSFFPYQPIGSNMAGLINNNVKDASVISTLEHCTVDARF